MLFILVVFKANASMYTKFTYLYKNLGHELHALQGMQKDQLEVRNSLQSLKQKQRFIQHV